jgi:hypothetical protein
MHTKDLPTKRTRHHKPRSKRPAYTANGVTRRKQQKKHSVGRELLAALISIIILILQLILAGERALESQRSKDQTAVPIQG